jgi:nucleotide-binding universal stress UspA family protein
VFKKILVALDHSKADAALLPMVKELARLTGAEILLLHVSTGWAAQWREDLNLADSREMQEDRDFLNGIGAELLRDGYQARTYHACGQPATEILRVAQAEQCDLIAMTTHGHRLISDLVHGTTITKVRHESAIPIFLVKAEMD